MDYWTKRAAKDLAATERTSVPYIKKLIQLHNEAERQIVRDVQDLYATYYRKEKFSFELDQLNQILPEGDIQRLRSQMKESDINVELPEHYKGRMTRLEGLYAQNQLRINELLVLRAREIHKNNYTNILKYEYSNKTKQLVDAYPDLQSLKLRELNKRGYKHYFPNFNKDGDGNYKEWKFEQQYPLSRSEFDVVKTLLKNKQDVIVLRRVEGVDGISMPDLFVNKVLTEIKNIKGKESAIWKNIKHATQDQGAKSVILRIDDSPLSIDDAKREIVLASQHYNLANYGLVKGSEIVFDNIQKERAAEGLHRQGGSRKNNLTQPLHNVNPFAGYNQRELDAILKSKFAGANYSERVWGNANKLARQLQDILAQAVASGQSEEKTSRLIRERFMVSKYEAERLIRTESAYFAAQADMKAYEETGTEKIQFLATLDSRTSVICQHHDHKIIELAKAKIGVNIPPLHPWCRSTTIPVVDGMENYVTERRARDGRGDGVVIDNKPYFAYDKDFGIHLGGVFDKVIINDPLAPMTLKELIYSGKELPGNIEINELLEDLEIGKLVPQKLRTTLSEAEIIARISGGDETGGSCASLVLAYVGNKAGYDVLDFRGGMSRLAIGAKPIFNLITRFNGVWSKVVIGHNDYKVIGDLLEFMIPNREYILAVGRHAAGVRLNNSNEYEYLELQSKVGRRNGWTTANFKKLARRFDIQKSYTRHGKRISQISSIIDVDSLKRSSEFVEMLKYLNTSEGSQLKGDKGSIK